ncbi:MAG: pantetheine-phosphate adenylyltransferase [Ignavibacteriae bacterium]|nr:pantetheine-phosphate adenylyltransferase [Ignavibacteriota bacterium]
MKVAIYPGTFDPITYGHIDVIERAREIFDKVIVTVARNTTKRPFFSVDERVRMIKDVLRTYKKVEVSSFNGLLVDFARSKKATAIIRGLRAVSDFEYEFQMALTNRKLDNSITTVFLMPHEKYTYLNSTLVREIALFGGDLSDFVPPIVQKYLAKKVKRLRKK